MIKVGTNSFGYNHMRNFAGLPFEGVEFKKVQDLYKIPAHFHYKLRNKIVHKYINRFNDFGMNGVDVYHFFNSITPIKKPWVVTFETTLPRMDADFEDGYRWLSAKYCKKIIAYTQRAFDAELYQLRRFPQFEDAIRGKMMLLLPSQRVLTDQSKKDFSGDLIFTMVGNAFFLKGGGELVWAFERFRQERLPVRLNIISRMEVHGFKDTHVKREDVEEVRSIVKNNPLIKLYEGLPNSEVVSILKNSHLGILPSYSETFGYSLLEAMACGCAVVSTDVSPFPEFVRDDWGWRIPVPTKHLDGLETTDSDGGFGGAFSNALKQGIYNTVHKIISDRKLLAEKAQNAITSIIRNHNPDDRIRVLSDIYKQAIKTI